MKKVIVTGGSGFIGTNLVNFLIKKRFFVINLDKLTYSSNKYKNEIRNNRNYKLIKTDIINKNKLIKIIKKKFRSNENHRYAPSSPYSASKASADHLVKSYIRTYKLNAVISNCCNNYGPFQFPEKLIPKMISNIFNNKDLPIYANGKNSREWIHVRDHCEALFTLYLKGKNGESYNVGSGTNLSNINLVKKILKICKSMKIDIGNKTKIKFVKDRPGHDFRYALDNKKIFKQLKWRSKISFDKGLTETILWYFQNKKFLNTIAKKSYEKRLGLQL